MISENAPIMFSRWGISLQSISATVLFIVILFLAMRLLPYLEKPTGGFMAYYTAGKLLRMHEDLSILYDDKRFHDMIPNVTGSTVEDVYRANPPTLALLFFPLSFFPVMKAKLLWVIVSLILSLISFSVLQEYFKLNRLETIVWLALFLVFNPLYINFIYGQLYSVLLLIFALLLRYWHDRKLFLSSLMIALMFAVKGYGVTFLLLALFLKEWKIVLFTIMNFLIIVFVSSTIVGLETWQAYFSSLSQLIGSASPAVTFQQNIQSFINWIFVTDTWNPNPLITFSSIAMPLFVTLFVLSLALLYWFSRRSTEGAFLFAFSSALIIGVLFAPVLYDYHYVFFIIPILACYKGLGNAAPKLDFLAFALSVFLLSTRIPYSNTLFQNTWLGLFAFPRIFGASILLLILFRITKRHTSQQSSVLLNLS